MIFMTGFSTRRTLPFLGNRLIFLIPLISLNCLSCLSTQLLHSSVQFGKMLLILTSIVVLGFRPQEEL
jgi:hypothetical protein